MASINQVTIIGNLGQDPEVREIAEGRMVAKFSLATSRNWTDKAGERHEDTEWHRIEVFGKTAEIVQKYLTKGRQVYIQGYLKTDKWQDKDGKDQYATKIVCENMQMLGGNPDKEQKSSRSEPEATTRKSTRPADTEKARPSPAGSRRGSRLAETSDIGDDDIPF